MTGALCVEEPPTSDNEKPRKTSKHLTNYNKMLQICDNFNLPSYILNTFFRTGLLKNAFLFKPFKCLRFLCAFNRSRNT